VEATDDTLTIRFRGERPGRAAAVRPAPLSPGEAADRNDLVDCAALFLVVFGFVQVDGEFCVKPELRRGAEGFASRSAVAGVMLLRPLTISLTARRDVRSFSAGAPCVLRNSNVVAC
jgi:hypothetical protein